MSEETPETVAEQVQKILNTWNEPVTDYGMQMMVGVPTDPADGRATGSLDTKEMNRHMASAYSDDVDAAELKGKALDEALEEAGLPKSGTADEKRERLAAHQAGDDG